PDPGGWAHWEANTAAVGRNATRAGFDWSTEFEMHVAGTSPFSPPGGATVPQDGWGSLHYDNASNRINDPGWSYDANGNQTRVQRGAGWQRYQYDAANRLVKVKADDNVTVLTSYMYGDTNLRLMIEEGGTRTYFASEGGTTMSEFVESGASTTPAWSKSYVYFGERLLSTLTPNGSGGEITQHHHPDRLGTRVVSNPSNGTSFEQVTLPFGTALNSESTGSTNRRFTTYDRSGVNGLDYALNRHYDSDQGRFTQVDPIGMRSVSLTSPQTLNLYAYCANDPVNHVDPSGLGFFSFLKKLFKGIAKFIAKVLSNKWVLLVVGIALGVISGFGFYWAATITTEFFLPAAITLAAMSAALIVSAFHPNFLRVVRTIGAIASTVQGAIGLINRTINGRILAGTPPWNPGSGVGPVSNFQAGGVRRPLDDIQKSIFDVSIKFLLARLNDKNSPCAKFLREKLGLSSTRVARALKGIRAFDGKTSTLTLKDAGLLPLSERGSTTTSVAALFRDPNLNAARAAYATPDDRGATLRDIYFGYTFRPQTILHETLHFFTGMNDDRLAAALGVKLEGVETGGISEALKNAGCGF
ncbi:MAG TPA: RHS repeat-associated core domain-containing protein, partial [Pyrinomonadaceae bacterium]|nr:RHS repeat-associated core domain-containing protein [Pyrinomonadaceae bacterium]